MAGLGRLSTFLRFSEEQVNCAKNLQNFQKKLQDFFSIEPIQIPAHECLAERRSTRALKSNDYRAIDFHKL